MSKAIRDWFDWRGWTVAAGAVVIALGLLAIFVPASHAFFASGTTAAWGSAVGTFAAAATALYVSTRQESKEAKERFEIGLNVVSLITPELGRVYVTLVKIAHMMQRISDPGPEGNRHERARKEVLLLLTELDLSASTTAFEKLQYMPNLRGRHVATLIGILPDLKRHLTAFVKTDPAHPDFLEFHRHHASIQIGRAVKSIMHGLGVGDQLQEVNEVLIPHIAAAAEYFTAYGDSVPQQPTAKTRR